MTGTYVPPAPPTNTPFLIFTMTATNIGTAQANNVLIFSTSLPSGATLSGLTNCSAGNPIICNCGNVPAGNPCVGQIRYIPSGSGSYSVSATVSASNDSNGGNNNASATAIVPLRQSPLVLELRTSLIAPPTDGRVRGQLIVNDSSFIEVDNGGPRTIHTDGRPGRNRFRGSLTSDRSGRWRFDFAGTARFVPGSIRVESGQVLTLEASAVEFRVDESNQAVSFTADLEDEGRR